MNFLASLTGFFVAAASVSALAEETVPPPPPPPSASTGTLLFKICPLVGTNLSLGAQTNFAIMYFDADSKTWVSKGWFSPTAGSCRDVSVEAASRTIFIYGQIAGTSLVWNGTDAGFCIDNANAFTLSQASFGQTNCTGGNFAYVGGSGHILDSFGISETFNFN